MAHVFADRVLESSITTGTGPVTLAGAVLGFQRFSAVCAVNDTVPYYIEAVDASGRPTGDWELGRGTYSAANQLTRTTVRASSNGGGPVNFAAGTKIVGLGVPAPNTAPTRDEWQTALGFSTLGKSLVAAADQAAARALLGLVTDVGEITWFARNTPPTGFIKANGAAVSRTTYSALFAAIGTTFGAGDGSTTFNVPDLRAEFIRGWDDSRGVDSGRAFGSTQTDAMQGHFHGGVISAITTSANFSAVGSQAGQVPANTTAPTSDGTNGTPRTAAETRPRNVALLACIRF